MTIVVRYAPSPTGPYQHVGGIRTLLFNYIFARKNGGKFYIRVEDTDQKRYNNNAITDLIQSLIWLGLDWDAGPSEEELIRLGVEETYARRYGKKCEQSYVQSQRNDKYYVYAHNLIESGNAYPVFSDDSIEETEPDKIKARMDMDIYRWRSASQFMIKKAMATNKPYHIRLRMPREYDGYIVCRDYLRGDVRFPYKKLYDPVLLKTPKDGVAIPSYHLAHVVDDHLMNTTHVLRGEEWLSSLPYHKYLFDCFGWDAPIYVHLPVILNPTGRGKMSKRETKSGTGEIVPVFLNQYKHSGYLPEAMINFMSLIGWNPGNNNEIFSLDDILDLFSLDRINRTGAKWDIRKLKSMNNHYIRHMPLDRFAIEAERFI